MEGGKGSAVSGQQEAIRSFIAVDTSRDVKEQVSGLLRQLKDKTPVSVKWVKPEQMHLTLVFLGEVAPDFIELVKAQLKLVARNFKPFECQIEGLGAFPSPSRARVLWAGLSAGERELKELQSQVSRALTQIGYMPEKRPFSPHLTLGRLREMAEVNFIKDVSFASSTFTITQLILFQSVLRPTGPKYSKLAELALGRSHSTA